MTSTIARIDHALGSRTGLTGQVIGYAVAGGLQGMCIASLIPLLRALDSDSTRIAVFWLGIAAFTFVASAIALTVTSKRGDRIGTYVVSEGLMKLLAARVVRLPLGWFTGERTGSLVTLVRGAGEVGMFPAMVLQQTTLALSTPVAVVAAVGIFVDWRLALAFVLLVPVGWKAYCGIQRGIGPAREQQSRSNAELSSRVIEFARAQPVVRAGGGNDTGLAALSGALEDDRRSTIRVLDDEARPMGVYGCVVNASVAVVLVVASWLLTRDSVDAVAVVAVLVLVLRFAEPIGLVGPFGTGLQLARIGLADIEKVIHEPVLPEPENPKEPVDSGIEIDRVTFGYGGAPVLRGLTLHCPPGTMTALVGASGAGKSTVARLIARFWDVEEGYVRIGGVDVRDMTTETLMRNISMVFQHVYLFDTSIEENVRMGRPDATDADVRTAARAARLDEVVDRLPLGWATSVGEGGSRLSGGERQRVSIARAILKDAPIVLLDEVTAALDAENEASVVAAISRLAEDKTVLVVAHRLATIAHADRIAFIADGAIAEFGTHDSLLAADGRYASFWQNRSAANCWQIARD